MKRKDLSLNSRGRIDVACIFGFALLLGFMSISFAAGSDSRDAEYMYDKYNEDYSLCDELKEEEDNLDDDCLLKMKPWNLTRMAEILMACGQHEEALPYIAEYHKKPSYGYFPEYRNHVYNEVFLLEALYGGNEEKILEEGLKSNSYENEGGQRRHIASVHTNHGDFRKAITIIEEGLSKEPDSPMIANDLSLAYLLAGNFEEAKKHAEYSLERDATRPEAYYVLAWVYYFTGDYNPARDYLNKGNDFPNSSGSFIEGWFLVTDGEYDSALKSFEQVKSELPYVTIQACHRIERDFSDFYMKLHEDEGGIPEVNTLQERSNKYYEEEGYHTAGMYFLLLSMIEPKQTSHYYDFARMMELHEDIPQAARYYSLYLALKPDSDNKQRMLEFLESREAASDNHEMGCTNYFEDEDCNSHAENCCWSATDSKCLDNLRPCFAYRKMDLRNSTPSVSECYWNQALHKCIDRREDCGYYKSPSSCRDAPMEQECVWDYNKRRRTCKNRRD